MTCIKNLGHCLCPRCLTPKQFVSELGTVNDRRRRRNVRIDNEHLRGLIERARKKIFEKGRLINGKNIQNLLGNQSLTPTRVSSAKNDDKISYEFRMRFLRLFGHMVSTTMTCLWSIFSMR